ncbi:putative damage-inducible protein DinB [Spinactinospora alkalitolerans]|uniref:Putative damage-inducible protein DinB n=1 Tax=Spinactinospora alkalitolerans TaxID=687207 RepID=A0A852U3P0_9ACTN|nr:DinB family protein [Spinactinospora alkalitolerans]NYE48570.1 putative damage-inducible protein DinB [Spinactinospora alkalitolerans]
MSTVIDPRIAPPAAADERTLLNAWLDRHRATVRYKCAGLDPSLAAAAPLSASPLMSIGGIVSHLRWVEHLWFEVMLLGLPDRGPYTSDDPDAEWRLGARRPLADLLDEYDAQCERSRGIAARVELCGAARRSPPGEQPATLRWVLLHMLEETARHNGHLDVLREMADGVTGD